MNRLTSETQWLSARQKTVRLLLSPLGRHERLQVCRQLHRDADMIICIAEIENYVKGDEKLTGRDTAFCGHLRRCERPATAQEA
jgi:hypothetical protein